MREDKIKGVGKTVVLVVLLLLYLSSLLAFMLYLSNTLINFIRCFFYEVYCSSWTLE